MRTFFISLLLLVFSTNINAQFTGLKGVTVQATSMLFIEDNEPKSTSVDMVYVVSFTDKILTHIIYKDGSISESQVYQIRNDVSSVDDNNNTTYKFDAVSGISGNTYRYEIKIDKDGNLSSLKLVQSDGENTIYKGGITSLKTYRQ